ncbi:MAG: hypothetical protein GY779_16250, partial [Gammaproteobacteria bacterium]|nr:hypothetical protein [Gammaproteobacteria bacterium]
MKTSRVIARTLTIYFCLLTGAVSALDAPLAMVPAGLNSGDEFYIIFVTSGTTDAVSMDIADYNAFVNTQADNSGVKGTDDATITWKAVVGTSGGGDQCDPYDGDATATAIYNLNGDKVADDRADMFDASLDNPILYDQDGNALDTNVWTGCYQDGNISPGFLMGDASPTYGESLSTVTQWVGVGAGANTNTYSIYAVSPKLTVPIVVEFSQQFSPDSIAEGNNTTLTYTINNTDTVSAATALAFTNTLPGAIEVAPIPNEATTCTGGTLTAVAGASVISYTGGTVSASSSCTISVDITEAYYGALPRSVINTSGDLTSSLGNSGTSNDTLEVIEATSCVDHRGSVSITKTATTAPTIQGGTA